MHEEMLLPGRRAAPPHSHASKEELVFVLAGHPSLWINENLFELSPGDTVGFPAGETIAHTIVNRSDAVAVILTIASNSASDFVLYAQDSEST